MNTFLPEIRTVHRNDKPDQVCIVLHLPASLAHFCGHFPGLPLLPGVVQIDWAARFAREYLGVNGQFTMLENIKFQALLLPEANVELTLIRDVEKNRVEFAYSCNQKKHSSGRLQFDGEA